LCPQALSTAKRASPRVPFRGQRDRRPSVFHVADFRFDGASAAEICDEFRLQAAPRAADQHAGSLLAMAAIAAVDDGEVGAPVGQDLHLFEGFLQGMAVVGIAREAAHADDEALVQRGRHADLAAELMAHPRLALGDASTSGSCRA